MKLLIIEDEKQMANTLKDSLSRNYLVEISTSIVEGEVLIFSNDYDLVILDLMLKGKNGIDLVSNLRRSNNKVPILVLTGRVELESKVSALNAGADDYLTKPFEIDELRARIRSLLRRSANCSSNMLFIGDLIINPEMRTVERCGVKIKLTKTDFNLLEYMARNIGRVITRDMILNHVWESNNDSLTNVVDVHIKYLRDRIDKPYNTKMIKTIHGFGYKLEIQ